MNPTKTEAIETFLKARARPELSRLYSPAMEVQVNVAQGSGDREDREFNGTKYSVWTDGIESWKNIRIPRHANTEPEYKDHPIAFDLAKHAEGIGLTGWDWQDKKSRFVVYDFDAIVGHSEQHQAKLTESELDAVRQAAWDIPWVEVRRSTSGNGLHLYVFVDEIDTANHTEHAALARSILGKLSALTGFDFDSKVDNCGHVMWIWHRKFERAGGVEGPGFELLKRGEIMHDIPINWRDHIRVTKGKRRRNVPGFINEKEIDWFEEMCGQHPKVPLDDTHKALITFLEKNAFGTWWWDADHHMLVCHTSDLKRAHEEYSMRGIFETTAHGQIAGDQNAFAFPMRRGAWVVRRHSPGVQEHDSWDQDASGWTRCYLNRDPDLRTASKTFGGAEDDKGNFVFHEAEMAARAAQSLGAFVEIDKTATRRQAVLRSRRDGKLILEIDSNKDDQNVHWRGWVQKKNVWQKVLNGNTGNEQQEIGTFDDLIRHVVSESGGDAGWAIRADEMWKEEPLPHVKLALKSLGHSAKDSDLIMGQAVLNRWILVNRPFMPEYVGNRMWNRDAAQLAFTPTQDLDDLKFPTWRLLLDHCGFGLDNAVREHVWCKEKGIQSGGEYLLFWVASLFQKTFEPLPYLFFYGPQGSGKSIFHEAIGLLMTKGVVRADAALISQSGFNGELASAVLCVVEETDLRQNKGQAYNRIKDWVTSRTMSIHVKGVTPYTAPNSTHWLQCANEVEACPTFPGDTRITFCYVDKLDPEKYIAKRDLLERLKNEAPDFLAHIMSVEIPMANDRLCIPVIETADKTKASKMNMNELESFIEEQCHVVSGEMVLFAEFYDRFREWLDPERRPLWTKVKMGRHLPPPLVKGRNASDGSKHYIGNISWLPPNPGDPLKPEIYIQGEKLIVGETSGNLG